MNIDFCKGKKGEKDRIIKITTAEKEPFSIYKLAILINQLTINEWNINGDAIKRTGKFFFRMAIEEAIQMAEEGIDWSEEENITYVKDWCKKYMLRFERIEPELRKVIQTRLGEFKNENK